MSRKNQSQIKPTHKLCYVAEYDLWFRRQVNMALNVAKSPHAIWIKAEDVRARMKQRSESRLAMKKIGLR